MGKSTINGKFSIAVLNYQRVSDLLWYPKFMEHQLNWSMKKYLHWLVVSSHSKNISQIGSSFPIFEKIKIVPNYQPVMKLPPLPQMQTQRLLHRAWWAIPKGLMLDDFRVWVFLHVHDIYHIEIKPCESGSKIIEYQTASHLQWVSPSGYRILMHMVFFKHRRLNDPSTGKSMYNVNHVPSMAWLIWSMLFRSNHIL